MAYQMGHRRNPGQRRMRANSYELSFSPEFFFAEGEPYDALSDTKRPMSVWAAIEGMRLHDPERWADLAKEVFGLDNPEYLTPETVMDKVQETNTCGTLSSPVDVYIDPEGYFTLDVYDEMRDNGRPSAGPAKFESGAGPYTVYFEVDGVPHHIRRRTLKAAKTEALVQAQSRGIFVTVQHKGHEVFEAPPSAAHRRNASFNLKKYGSQMLQWHSGMDAIYAVGSFATDGKVHPDPSVIERAQSLLESYSHSDKWSARDQREAKLLAQQTGELAATHPRATGERWVSDDPDALDSFTHGYLEAALFSTNDESDDSGGEPLDKNYSIADIAPEAVESAKRDCAQFQSENAESLEGFDPGEAGADFWFTRGGHGVGFWDGDYPEPQATRLTDASKKFGEVWLTVGDDGLIYST